MHGEDNKTVQEELVLTPSQNKRLKILGTIALAILILSVSIIFVFVQNIELEEEKTERLIHEVNELEWALIESIIEENLDKANIQANSIKENIERRIIVEYDYDYDALKQDFDLPTEEARFTKIVNEEMSGQYINVMNDNNDPFLAFTNFGVFSDKSLNCSSDGEQRTWEQEIDKHANSDLASQAVNALVNMDTNKTIFWEFLPSMDEEHEMLNEMSMHDLKKVFLDEGIEGLSTYEFLSPAYITPEGDIFGTADVDNRGYRLENYKIIVVQGFNVVDDLTSSKKDKLSKFTNTRKIILREYEYEKTLTQITLFLILGIILLTFITVISVYNNEIDELTRSSQKN